MTPRRYVYEADGEWLCAIPSQVALRAEDQVEAARAKLRRPADAYLRWPFPGLDALTGPLGAGGAVWIVAAFLGSGKTTYITSVIDLWRRLGKRIYAMPLETQAPDFRTYLACLACGISPGDVLSGNLALAHDGEAKRAAVDAALVEQKKRPYVDEVMVSELRAIDVPGFDEGCREAKSFGADVVIVDHIDHIAGGDGSNAPADSKRVCHAALEIAQENELTLVLTSQLNMNIARNPDHLAKYAPPRVQDLWLPGVKGQVATGIIGLCRRIRPQKLEESAEEYAALVKGARAGTVPPPEVLDPHVMAVNLMKSRYYGAHEGRRIYLRFDRGRVLPMPEPDRYATADFGSSPRRVVP